MKIKNLSSEEIVTYGEDIKQLLNYSHSISFPEKHYDEEYYETKILECVNYIKTGNTYVKGILNNNSLIGLIWYFIMEDSNEKEIHINHFVINETFSNLGYGTKLLKEVINHASKSNIKKINLNVTPKNKKAIKFYEKNNFLKKRMLMEKEIN